ncbi:Phosphatidylserine decarboxylase proenzyme 2 [Bienertia sinuspersici]
MTVSEILDSDSDVIKIDLLDPSSSDIVVGKLSISCFVEDPEETEKDFARRILSIMDYNEDGLLSFSEFSDLIDAFGNQVAADKKEELFKDADKNGDGVVSIEELASLLAIHQEKEFCVDRIGRVQGDNGGYDVVACQLVIADDVLSLVDGCGAVGEWEPLITSCPVCGEMLDASNQVGSMVHMTLCFNEGTGNNVMSGGFVTDKQASLGWLLKLSEWAQYSSYGIGLNKGSKAGHILSWALGGDEDSGFGAYCSDLGIVHILGGKETLQKLSEKQGEKMNSADSVKEIPKFIDTFKTFNEFFIRELKPGARPIASIEHDDVAVCAADCRLMAFKSVEESTRFWIKGRKFSVQGLLGNDVPVSPFIGGALVIFRLAPQVAFVAIGATMVGSMTFTREEGDYVQKGDEVRFLSLDIFHLEEAL